jgi:hypothetical protein
VPENATKSAKVGLGGTLVLQTGSFGLLFAPLTPSLSVWAWAMFCNLGGWLALFTVLYVMTKQR